MAPFDLSEDQAEFRSAVRRLARGEDSRHVPPNTTRTSQFPWESFHDCVAMELPALGVPEEYGGAGADHVTQAVMVEEVARVCASTSVTLLDLTSSAMIPVINFGTEELKRRYLPPVAAGAAQASYCLSEPDAGSTSPR